MKTCQNCGSTTFDDMEMCFDCMSSFVEHVGERTDELEASVARLQVSAADMFCYELLLHKLEGRSLSIGSASENALVIPQKEASAHRLDVFYAHGQIWVENTDTLSEVMVSEMPLHGKTSVTPGSEIKLGDTLITVLEV